MIDHVRQLTNTYAQRAEMPLPDRSAAAAELRRTVGARLVPWGHGWRWAAGRAPQDRVVS